MEPTQPSGPRGARGASARLGPGSRVGPYELGALLGAGGMGEVFRARDLRLGRDVALKVLPPRLASDEEAARRFEHEARAAASVSHPNVMAVYDVGTHEGVPYVVCELVEGRPPSGKLPAARARELARQIAAGLAAAHEKGVVHRDLKPSNVLVGRDGVKILDFGLAKLVAVEESPASPHTATGAVMGTPGYMSPEQVRGLPVDHRTDIFSLGVILHELLAGAPAFDGPSRVERMAATLTHDPPLPPDTPPDLARVVARCLEKDPARRFQSALDLAFALEGESLPPPPARSARSLRLGRRLLAAAALLGALAIIVGVLAATQGAAVPRAAPPTYERLTFRHGRIWSARFSRDGAAVVYAASWSDAPRVSLYTVRQGSPESQPLPISGEASLLAVAPSGDLAVLLLAPERAHSYVGVLARAPAAGGAARPLLEGVLDADYGPDGELAVAHRDPDGGDTVEYPVGKVLHRTTGFYSAVRVARDGQHVAALHHPLRGDDRGEVLIIDRDGRLQLRSRAFKSIAGLAWSASPSGSEDLWFTASDGQLSGALRALAWNGDDRVIATAPGRLMLHDIAADGRVLLSREDSRTRLKVSPPGVPGERDLSWFDSSAVADLSTDGRQVLFYESGAAGGAAYRSYLRDTDGAPAVLLGAGIGVAISPDGAWALLASVDDPRRLDLVPTGAGTGRSLDPGALVERMTPGFLPDGRVIYTGREAGADARWRIHVQAVGGAPEPVGEPGLRLVLGPRMVTPDGKHAVGLREGGEAVLVPLDGGAPRRVAGFARHERLAGFDDEGHAIVYPTIGFPCRVALLDTATGERRKLYDLSPPEWETAGVAGIDRLVVTPDGKGYAYSLTASWGELHVASGVR